jgi:hypothetical protein
VTQQPDVAPVFGLWDFDIENGKLPHPGPFLSTSPAIPKIRNATAKEAGT